MDTFNTYCSRRMTWHEVVNEFLPSVEEFLTRYKIEIQEYTYTLSNGIFCIEFKDPDIALLFKLAIQN